MNQQDKALEQRIAWWEEARFGLFIHWGIYAVPAGVWKGQEIPGIGEWIMNRARIPVEEYRQLAKDFNPTEFDAQAWVDLAKDAGMKYLVITAKHHDGFAMYDSAVSDYTIVKATPYQKDPLKELAAACQQAGIAMCFYYSQDQDWEQPNASGNTWDWPEDAERDFGAYLEDKVKPQLRELLTDYGPIGLIWFDTPMLITKEQSLDLKRFVHSLQPDCLVSGRVGHDVGDYGSLGDNQIPAGPVKGYWETPATLNDTWGFKVHDHNWKSTETLLFLLVDLASKGVNYLLNVGPTAEGIIPEPSKERLLEIGAWMRQNGEAIYGTKPSPFAYEFAWGRITQKGNKLYLLFTEWPGASFTLYGLRSEITGARLLSQPDQTLETTQDYDPALQRNRLQLKLPAEQPDTYVPVVELTVVDSIEVDNTPMQQPDGEVSLPVSMATVHSPSPLAVNAAGFTQNWTDTGSSLSWECKIYTPGRFGVTVSTAAARRQPWQGGHRLLLTIDGKPFPGVITHDEEIRNPRTQYFQEIATHMGTIEFTQPGLYQVTLKAEEIKQETPGGLVVGQVRLVPQRP